MRADLLALLAAREERITVGGREVIVREMASAADTAGFADETDIAYKILVRCVFDLEGNPVFTDDDIPALRAAGRLKLAPLMAAVTRVNGFDTEAEAKNSGAAPG